MSEQYWLCVKCRLNRFLADGHSWGFLLACFTGDDKIQGKFLKGGKPLDDRDLLPPDLKEQSLSDREIVLTLENASRAIEYLEAAQWAVAGWEPWLKLANGNHLHPIAGGSFAPEEQEDWAAYVHRTAQLCRQVMKEEQALWNSGKNVLWKKGAPDGEELTLYFCLTVTSTW